MLKTRHLNNQIGSFHLAGIMMFLVALVVGYTGYRIMQSSHADAPGGPIVGQSAKCLDNKDNKHIDGNRIQLWECNGSDAQRWVYTADTIQSSGYCIAIPGDSTASSTAVKLEKCDKSSGQTWTYRTDKTFFNPHAGLCLANRSNDSSNGNIIHIYSCSTSKGMLWSVSAANSVGIVAPTQSRSTLTIASWNSQFDNSASDLGDSVKQIAASAQIIGVQEVHDHDKRTDVRDAMLCATCSYSSNTVDFKYEGSSPASLMILWNRNRFIQMGEAGSLEVSPYTVVNDNAGDTVSAKYITWVKLKDVATGKQFYVLDTHTVASIEAGGLPDNRQPKRVKLYAAHMAKLTDLLASLKTDNLPIFLLGDFNVNYRYDSQVKDPSFPFMKLRTLGLRSNWETLQLRNVTTTQGTRATSSDRIIDYIYSSLRSDVEVTDERINSSSLGSDHYPVFTTVTLIRPTP